jgi:hypothetical protein
VATAGCPTIEEPTVELTNFTNQQKRDNKHRHITAIVRVTSKEQSSHIGN